MCSTNYTYNNNGNLTADANKGITSITYNHLNLPTKVNIGSNSVSYTYNATGTKYKKTTSDGYGTRYYFSNFEYDKNMNLEYIHTTEGRIRAKSNFVYDYYLKDHLGNTRVVFTDENNDNTPEVLQVDNYYPFGMRHGQANAFSAGGNTTQYMYNGKELQQDFNLDWYDYGARMYDPALGRFHTQDRFSEKYYSLSNYQYAANNPIALIDINGDSIWVSYRNERILYEDGNLYTVGSDGSKAAYAGKGLKKDGSLKGFLGKTVDALGEIGGTEDGGEMLGELQSSDNNFTISHARNNPNTKGGNEFVADNRSGAYAIAMMDARQGNPVLGGSGGTIYWNPKSGSTLEMGGGTAVRSTTNLAHELFHGWDSDRGWLDNRPYNGLKISEWRAVYFENRVRNQMGLPYRTHYRSQYDVNTGKKTGLPPSMLQHGYPVYVPPPSLLLAL